MPQVSKSCKRDAPASRGVAPLYARLAFCTIRDGHCGEIAQNVYEYVIITIDYFTKWAKVVLSNIRDHEVIAFV